MSVKQDLITKHWNTRAGSYNFNAGKDFFCKGVDVRWRDLLAEAIGDPEPKKVLDAGCGPAVLTRILLELGHEVAAVDVSEKMIELARNAVGENRDKVSFHQTSVDELPFEDSSFDLVFSRYVVWTLPQPVKAIREWQRILKPGGRVGIIDGNWYYHYYRSRLKKVWSSMVHLTYKIRSGFDPGQKLATNYALKLPSTYVLRPDWDMGVLEGMGFEDIRVFKNLEDRIWDKWTLDRLKNPWNHQFLIMALNLESQKFS